MIAISLPTSMAFRLGGSISLFADKFYIAELLLAERLSDPQSDWELEISRMVGQAAASAGLPRPPVYILPKVKTINSAVIGRDSRSAVIVFSQGAVTHLTGEEIKALAIHGFARMLNGDAPLALTMSGWLQPMLVLAEKADSILDTTGYAAKNAAYYGTGNSGTGLATLAGLILKACNLVGYLSAMVLEAVFFRRRCLQADIQTGQLMGGNSSLVSVRIW